MASAEAAPADARRSAEPSLAPAAPLIQVQGLCRNYGQLVAVRDLSFEVGHGEVVGFLGPNGAGKSTTLRMIVGYLAPSQGRVRVAGHDVVEEPLRARRAIGYMPESAPLYPEMRVAEYLAFRARLKRIARPGVRREVERVMSLANVAEVGRSLIGTLSRGFRQRVALADALIGNPPLLILDEPTAGLDPNQIHDVRELIGELGDTHTVLLSTHILSEVESICNRAIVIDRGTLVAAGPIHELRRRRSNPRASITVHDVGQQALPLLLGSEHVLGVTPTSATPSLLPPPSQRESRAPGVSSPSLHAPDAIVSFIVTLQPGVDGHACLEDLVALLVHAQIRVREARLDLPRLEDVFRQLTGAGAETT